MSTKETCIVPLWCEICVSRSPARINILFADFWTEMGRIYFTALSYQAFGLDYKKVALRLERVCISCECFLISLPIFHRI